MNQNFTHNDERVRDTALSWIARLRADTVSELDRQEFALWLAQDSANKQAMDSMLDMWDDLGSVRKLPFPAQLTEPAANNRNWLAASVAVAASLVLAIFLWPQTPADITKVGFQTALGERRTVELEDHSALILNTDTRITVTYSDASRYIEMVRGEAYFEVSKDPDRPFIVNTGSAEVMALGTAFNIYRNGDSVSIAVTEGVVRVTELGITGARPAASEVLHANQHLSASRQGLDTPSSVDLASQLAWQEGKLIAHEMKLPELVAQLERYRDTRILISDSDIAALTISGVFELDQPDSILRALELIHGLEVVELGPKTVQLLKSSQ